MNYIYDIVLNFQDNYYQFFEWNRTDKIKNISKISVYRVTDQDLLNLKYNKVIIAVPFLNQIKEDNKKYKKLMCLVSNTKQSIGILIGSDGAILKKSSLLFEEEEEVNIFSQTLPITEINYVKNIKMETRNSSHLRIEIEKKDILIEYLNKTTDLPTLKYLYYEYYKEECDDQNQIKKSLLTEVKQEWTQKQNNLYQVVHLLTQKSSTMKEPS